jgi:L-ascorbate metabolism protein UlaG (beta-lactamase superfamily)
MIEIQWLGHSCFRIKAKEGIVVTDPYGPEVGLKLGRPSAHIVTVSHDEPDHNNVAGVKGMRGDPVVITGPGEYEVGGIFILGIRTYRDMRKGRLRGSNTVYVLEFAEMTICHLGDLGHPLSDDELAEVGNVGVLFVPVGGKHSLSAEQAAEVVGQIEPRIAIPMHYGIAGNNRLRLDGVDLFCHEMGIKLSPPQEGLRLGSGDLPSDEDETRIVVLKPGE